MDNLFNNTNVGGKTKSFVVVLTSINILKQIGKHAPKF